MKKSATIKSPNFLGERVLFLSWSTGYYLPC